MSVVALVFADLLQRHPTVIAIILALDTVAQARARRSGGHGKRRVPLVWILHVGYLWIVVHLSLLALSELELVSCQSRHVH